MIAAATFNDVLIAMFVFGGALIGGIAKIVHSLAKTRSENRNQHGAVGEALARVETKVDLTHQGVRDVAARLDDHINGPQHGNAQIISHPKHNTGGNSAA